MVHIGYVWVAFPQNSGILPMTDLLIITFRFIFREFIELICTMHSGVVLLLEIMRPVIRDVQLVLFDSICDGLYPNKNLPIATT